MAENQQAIELNMEDMVHELTLHVHVRNVAVWRVRFELGLAVLRVAAWVMGVCLEIEIDDEYARNQGAVA